MTTCYLDAEDEITGAISKLRDVQDRQAILVLPSGSRIATSRINFRLLARESTERGTEILVVSGEHGARALAISAGLPAYDSVAAAEAALAEFQEQDGRLAAQTGPSLPAGRSAVTEQTRVLPAADDAAMAVAASTAAPAEQTRVLPAPPAASATTSGRPPAQSRQQARPATGLDAGPATAPAGRGLRRRRLRLAPLVAVALLLLLAASAAYAGYVLLPTATISVQPHVQAFGPLEMTVVADPGVAVPDALEGVVPAQRLDVPLSVGGTFAATGSQVSQSRSTGTVRFRSENTLFDVPIPAGTRVSTGSGEAFETTRAVTLERASFASGPTTADAPVRALRAGPRGNVAEDAITRVPESLSAALVSVRNPQPTGGGMREEVTVVAAEDYDNAYDTLLQRLPDELQRRLGDPATTPRGLTLYPASARTVDPRPDQSAADLVETAGAFFSLSVEAAATVLAVNEGLVDQVVLERISGQVPAGTTMPPESIASERSAGTVTGDTVVYAISATARTYRLPDREALLSQVRGKSVSEAEAIMARYGSAQLSVWPEFIDRLPDQISRINLTILTPGENP
ncbi:hypothetical protein BH24CHL7_BH24CHL7_04730 [soil metagenome]